MKYVAIFVGVGVLTAGLLYSAVGELKPGPETAFIYLVWVAVSAYLCGIVRFK